MMEIQVAALAEQDLDSIWDYVAEASGNAETADRLILRIVSVFKVLASNPKAGIQREDMAAGLRCIPCGIYIVYYTMDSQYVKIVRIVHGMRDQHKAFHQ